MKLFAVALLSVLAGSATALAAPAAAPVAFELEGVTVSDVVSLVYRDLLRVPFALSPEVYADRRPLSVRFEANGKAARSQFRAYLTALGYRVRSVGGLDYVEPLPPPVAPSMWSPSASCSPLARSRGDGCFRLQAQASGGVVFVRRPSACICIGERQWFGGLLHVVWRCADCR